jgi:hypothetical protein
MPERLERLDLEAARQEADKEEGNGRVRALCLADQLASDGKLWLCRLDMAEFLAIAWQEDNNTRYVTTAAPKRTLGAVGEQIRVGFGGFEGLIARSAIPGQLKPEWFRKCADVSANFDWLKWTKPWLVPAKGSERRNSQETTLYVCEGVHRTIALAVGLLNGSIEWSPVLAIIAEERPAECC